MKHSKIFAGFLQNYDVIAPTLNEANDIGNYFYLRQNE